MKPSESAATLLSALKLALSESKAESEYESLWTSYRLILRLSYPVVIFFLHAVGMSMYI